MISRGGGFGRRGRSRLLPRHVLGGHVEGAHLHTVLAEGALVAAPRVQHVRHDASRYTLLLTHLCAYPSSTETVGDRHESHDAAEAARVPDLLRDLSRHVTRTEDGADADFAVFTALHRPCWYSPDMLAAFDSVIRILGGFQLDASTACDEPKI